MIWILFSPISVCDLVANVISGAIFSLLPINSVLLGLSMYTIENVRENDLFFISFFNLYFLFSFLILNSIYFSRNSILFCLDLMCCVLAVRYCGVHYFAILQIWQAIDYHRLGIQHMLQIGTIIRWNGKSLSF